MQTVKQYFNASVGTEDISPKLKMRLNNPHHTTYTQWHTQVIWHLGVSN